MYDYVLNTNKSKFTKLILGIILAFALSFSLGFSFVGCSGQNTSNQSKATQSSSNFEYWNSDAQSLSLIKDYVSDITNSGSQNYIPPEDRIVVFDMDGTMYGELAPIYVEFSMYAYRVLQDPTYTCTNPDMIRVANEIVEAGKTKNIPANLEKEHAQYAQEAFAGMTVQEYCDYVEKYLQQPVQGFDNATYADMWYLPMLNVVDYLNANDFQVYVVSGTDRYMIRTMLKQKGINVAENHVIGMDCEFVVQGKEEQDLMDYHYTPGDRVVRSNELLVKNVKMNKVARMVIEIGKKPVLAFGNSTGDTSMCGYVATDNKYKTSVFMVVADDDQRDYGNAEKAAKTEQTWKERGWNCISMKNDFKTIYDPKVEKSN